jgi:hypothetical protein
MKNIFFSILFIVSLALVSCASKKPVESVIITNTKEITHTVRDTIFRVAADSAYYEAYIECQNGKAVITKSIGKAGRSMSELKVIIEGNKLRVDAYKNEEELHKKWQETYIKEREQKPIYVAKPVYEDKPLTWWQNTQLWLGRIFLFFISIGVLSFILRWKKVI